MAKSKKRSNFFHDAGLKLNREIKAEQKEQAKTKQSGFMKQLNDHKTRDSDVYTKAKTQAQTDTLFKGESIAPSTSGHMSVQDHDPSKMNPTEGEASPQGSFQLEQRVNLFRKGVK